MVLCESAGVPASPRLGASSPAPASRSRTILVVEDEPLLCDLAAEVLEAEGHRVLTAADAEGALAVLRTEPVDLLFTDIDLAFGSNGLALAREARRLRPDLPVTYTSGRRTGLDGSMVTGSSFLPKPYRLMQLVDLAASLQAA